MKITAITTLAISAAYCISVNAGVPNEPTNVTLIKYSENTGELFWNRVSDTDGIKGYELMINGLPHWVGDVTSHLDTNLSSDSQRVYQIVAVDSYGNRSGPSVPLIVSNSENFESISQSTDSCSNYSNNGGTSSCSSSSNSQNQPEWQPPESTIPNPPEENIGSANGIIDLSAEVYSPTALEIFWNKPPEPTVTTEFHIRRNGEFVGRTDGHSYFDRDLSPGTDYQYEIRMIQSGNAISSDDIDVRTRGTTSSSSSSSSSSDGDNTSTVFGETYSASAIEIFWETSAQVSIFGIYRNGEYLGTYDASSYYDDNLDADTVYRYEVYSNGDSNLLGDISLKTSK